MRKTALLATFIFSFTNGYSQKNWEYLKTKNDIKVYQRDMYAQGIKQFRLTSTFKNTSLSAIFSAFRDHHSFPEWQKDIVEIHTVKKISDADNFDYYNISFPWPFKNRDAIYHQIISFTKKDKILNLTFTLDPEVVPHVEGIVRMKEAIGEWTFTKKDNGDIDVSYQNYSDPVGIPANIVNLLFPEALNTTLSNLRTHIQKEKYRTKKYAFIEE